MSVFDFPRIHVRGTHIVNTGTANNDSASPGEELSITCNTERVQPELNGKTDKEYFKWMMERDESGLLRSQWNYFGDMSFKFIDVRVRSVQLSSNYFITQESEDSLIGSKLFLNHAIMCDTNPEGFDSTQIFSESLQINSPYAIKNGSFISRKPSKATTRSLNWYRNVSYNGPFGLPPHGKDGELSSGGAGGASASFEHYIEILPEDILDSGDSKIGDSSFHKLIGLSTSPGMTALIRELKNNAYGLVFRYNLYLCSPIISDTELARRFEIGERIPNPAYGKLIGTISPLYKGEEKFPTMGRYLKPCNSFKNPYRSERPYYVAPVLANFNEKENRLSFDIANTFPEDGPDGNKFDIGKISVGLRKIDEDIKDPKLNTNPIYEIASIKNDRSEYQYKGGMIDLELDNTPDEVSEMLYNDSFEIIISSSLHGVLLNESEYMIAASSVCNYLDELPPNQNWSDQIVRERLRNEASESLRGEVKISALKRGRVPTGPMEILVEQWKITPTGTPNQYGLYKYPELIGKESLVLFDGRATYLFQPERGSGLRRFRFVPQGTWPQEITPVNLAALAFKEFFSEVRVLPYDDYSHISENDLNFKLIYDEIFRYYHLIFPAMSVHLDMSDPGIWTTPTTAQYVLRMIDTKLWDFHNYMPRTRDLSKYRRELLERFCRLVLKSNDIVSDNYDENRNSLANVINTKSLRPPYGIGRK